MAREAVVRRFLRGILWAFAGLPVAALLLGLLWSRLYWGYWIAPPEMPAIAGEVAEVTALARVVGLGRDAGGAPLSAAVRGAGSVGSSALPALGELSRDEAYWVLRFGPGLAPVEHRMFLALAAAGRVPADPAPPTAAWLQSLFRAAEAAGHLDTLRYGSLGAVSGYVARARTTSGRPIALAAWSGREVSNDHYPHRELVFDLDGPEPRVIDASAWYFDSSGIEGLDWKRAAGIAAALLAASLVALAVVGTVVLELRRVLSE